MNATNPRRGAARNTFSIFDTFVDDTGRDAHLNGDITKGLGAITPELVDGDPDLRKIDLVAVKQPVRQAGPGESVPPDRNAARRAAPAGRRRPQLSGCSSGGPQRLSDPSPLPQT